MKRRTFIQTLTAGAATMSMTSLKNFADDLPRDGRLMPLLFVGHGSPMNGIEDNDFSRRWSELGRTLPTPAGVLVVSAHWLTQGTLVTAMEHPRTIHDFGGFPQALYDVRYPASGDPALAEQTRRAITSTAVGLDHDWGLDHGTWTILRHMYPEADVPILQLSIDFHRPPQYHYDLARELAGLRKQGILIIGSGNMVHNLRRVAWDKLDEPDYGYDWALEMNDVFKRHIADHNHKPLINYESLGASTLLAIPTPDHYYPLLYVLGLQETNDEVRFFNDKAVGGSVTMTSVVFGE